MVYCTTTPKMAPTTEFSMISGVLIKALKNITYEQMCGIATERTLLFRTSINDRRVIGFFIASPMNEPQSNGTTHSANRLVILGDVWVNLVRSRLELLTYIANYSDPKPDSKIRDSIKTQSYTISTFHTVDFYFSIRLCSRK